MSWKLAPSLTVLFEEVNAEWPRRDKRSDGTIGDAAHSARTSQHNPNRDPGDDVPDGMVTAADIDRDGIDVPRLLDVLIGDPRVWYVIHDRRIWSRTHNWKPRPYGGSNPHTTHIHVSLNQNRESVGDVSPWGINDQTTTATSIEPMSVMVKPWRRHPQVRDLQRALIAAGYGPIPDAVTDYYGGQTQAAVARFHRAHPELAWGSYDPVIGPKGWRTLMREARG